MMIIIARHRLVLTLVEVLETELPGTAPAENTKKWSIFSICMYVYPAGSENNYIFYIIYTFIIYGHGSSYLKNLNTIGP